MIRRPKAQDCEAIHQLLKLAFAPSTAEAKLREHIIRSGEPFEEWLVEHDGQVIAYILFTQASKRETAIGYHLAPVAVHPEFQGYGIGSQLISDTIDREPICSESVFVLGDPNFYERFGFTKPRSTTCPFDQQNHHFRALRWKETPTPFTIGYVPAFGAKNSALQELR